MKLFVSYCFNDRNRWVEELVIPMATALGFDVVNGKRMEGERLNEEVDARLQACKACLAFTTQRYPENPRPDGTFETHPWVVYEMTSARKWHINTLEVREQKVHIGDANEGYVYFAMDARDRLLADLAIRMMQLKKKIVKIQLLPPDGDRDFIRHALQEGSTCRFEIESEGRIASQGEARIKPFKQGFFAEIEVPDGEVVVTLKINKPNNGAWVSFGDGLAAIPIQLY